MAISGQPLRQPPRRGVGAVGEAEPEIVLEVGLHLRPEEPSFRQRVSGALAQVGEGLGELRLEDDDGLAGERAVLGRAERQRVDPGAPGHLRRREAARDEGVGEARAVHVGGEASRPGDPGKLGDFVATVDRPGLRRLRERQRAGLNRLHEPARKAGERVLEDCGRRLAALARQADELRAAGEEFRGAAFVVMNVRLLVAEDGVERADEGGKRKRVGGGSGGNEKDLGAGLEHVAEHRRRPGGEIVAPHRPAR